MSEQNFPSKNKKFHDFDDEFLVSSQNNTNNIKTNAINYSLSQTVAKTEKINNELPVNLGFATIDEKENSPARNEKSMVSGKNRLKSSLKSIEESFDIYKKNDSSVNNNKMIDLNSNTGVRDNILRDRVASKKDSTLKFMEENLINQNKSKSPKESSPQSFVATNNSNTYTKKVENTNDIGEYEFESRRKKRWQMEKKIIYYY